MINGTVLGVAPIKTSLLVMGGLISVFCTLIEPQVSAGLSFLPRLAFWVSHVTVGLSGILLASLILSRCWPQKKLSLLVTIGLTGMLGTLLATPGLLLVEEFFPEEVDEEWLDVFGQRGWWQALLAEYLQVLPKLLPTWYLINLPLLFNKPVLNPSLPPSEEPDGPPPGEQARREEEMRQRREQLYQKLPEVIGRDIVAISSDLHYLNIHTVPGKILVLGSLKHYVEAFGDEGLLVHRSNWVAKRHVVKVRTSGDESYCLMSNGLKVPISRSRKKEVKAIFGDFVRTPQERRLTVVK